MGPTSSSVARSMSSPWLSSPRRRARRNGSRSRSRCGATNSDWNGGAADDARVGSGQERGDLAEMVTKVAAEVSVVGRGEMLSRVSEQRIEQDGGLRRHPAINSLF